MARTLTRLRIMKWIMVILCACWVGGCANRARTSANAAGPPHDFESVDDEQAQVASAALVFDPPVAAGEPPLHLARAVRQQAAFVAYDQVLTTYFYLRLDDRQKLSPDGTSERRVISETFGISRR